MSSDFWARGDLRVIQWVPEGIARRYHVCHVSKSSDFAPNFKAKKRNPFGKKRFDYIVVDESHHGQAPTYREVIDYFKPAFLLGMTATPDRMDMVDIREIFGPEVYSLDLEEALVRGLLTPVDYRVLADEIVNKGRLNVPPHLITVSKLNRIFFSRKRDEEIVQVILDRTRNMLDARIIVFDASIEHANTFATMMPGAVSVHSSIPRTEREKRMEWVRRGMVRTAVTVDQFNEGIDIPEANVLVFLRSTQSPRIFRQQLGRGLRKVPGKSRVLVLDFVANCERLVFLDELRVKLGIISKSRKLHIGKGRKKFQVDWGEIKFAERAKKITKLLQQAKFPLTKERLLQYLWNFYKAHGKAPVHSDCCAEHGMPAHSTFRAQFGSLYHACVLAGIPQNAFSLRITSDEVILDRLFAFYTRYRRAPRREELGIRDNIPSDNSLTRRFGGLFQACWFAGIPDRALFKTYVKLSKEELLSVLSWFYETYSRPPQTNDLGPRNHLPSSAAFIRNFGSMGKACKLAGIPEKKITKNTDNQVILAELKKFYRKLGRPPTDSDVGGKSGLPSSSVFARRFGSLQKARELAGILGTGHKKVISDKELLEKLIDFYRKYGRAPSHPDLCSQYKMPSGATIADRFDSLYEGCRLAGIPKKAFRREQVLAYQRIPKRVKKERKKRK
ncbi:MAG: DEAD/DEAH box helicase family protein [Patescibacteria group bacterium]